MLTDNIERPPSQRNYCPKYYEKFVPRNRMKSPRNVSAVKEDSLSFQSKLSSRKSNAPGSRGTLKETVTYPNEGVKKKLIQDPFLGYSISDSDINVEQTDKSTQTNKKHCRTSPFMEKQYTDVSINTDSIKPNASLMNVVSHKIVSTSECVPKLYQFQELPIVDIRPNLTKQIGPVIDIKVSKQIAKSDNVAVVECAHQDVFQENRVLKSSKKCQVQRNKISNKKERKSWNEIKIQKAVKEFLKKLTSKKGHYVDKLKKSLNQLMNLLNQITPYNTAIVKLEIDNMSVVNESIDLFFTNMESVREIIENELKKPIDKFCKYSERITKAVDLLCDIIKSTFVINEDQQNFTTTSRDSSYIGM